MPTSNNYLACLAVVFLLLLSSGCSDGPVIPVSADAESSGSQNQDYFDYAVDNLNHLSKFGPNQILTQIIDRLNQWSRIEQPQTAWQMDPLLATLPEVFQTGPLISNLEDATYTQFDGVYLRECALAKAVADYATIDSTDDLDAAKGLFNWTVAHVALDPESSPDDPPSAQLPWQTLLLGHGSPVDRAWLFSVLARQLDLDVVLFYIPISVAKDKQESFVLWSVGVILNGQIYLFDPTYGLPIPGPDGNIATLADLKDDTNLLRAWDLPDMPYWMTADLLNQVTPFIEASPQSLSKRMKSVQNALGGESRMQLANRPSQLADRVSEIGQTSRPRIWPWPFVASRILSDPDNKDRSRLIRELQQYGKFVTGSVNPLWAGRLQQLTGRYTAQIDGVPRRKHDAPIGENGAKPLLLTSRTMRQKLPKNNIPTELKKQIDFLYERSDVIARDATRHLATIAFDEGNFPLAQYYLDETEKQQSASNWPADTPKIDITMARGRVAEAAGQYQKALKDYTDVKGPEQKEAALRAKEIKKKLAAEKQQ